MSTEYKRERKEEKPVLAICYDFDKTLSPDDMQAQGFIQSVGYDVETFWKKSNGLASGNDMDQNLAYMLMMQQAAEGKKDETENLFTIAVNNSQVFYILGDMDVKAFYQKLLNGCKVPSENAEKIKARIEETDRL